MDNIIPLGHRHPSKLPHPKRILNGNQIDHALAELDSALAFIINPLRQQTFTTEEILTDMSEKYEEIRDARRRLNQPEYPLTLEEAITAFRFSLHHGKTIVVDDALDQSLQAQPDLDAPFEKLYLTDIPYCAYFKLGHHQPSSIQLPACGKATHSAPLEGFYFFQYDHPQDWIRDITITLIGTPSEQDSLQSHTVTINVPIYEGRPVYLGMQKENTGFADPAYAKALNHAYKVMNAFNNPPEQGWPYHNDHEHLFKTATTNRDVRLLGSFDHYTMESA